MLHCIFFIIIILLIYANTLHLIIIYSLDSILSIYLFVATGLRGTNKQLEDELDKIFNTGEFTMQGSSHPVIPKDIDLDAFLEDYYRDMAQAKD